MLIGADRGKHSCFFSFQLLHVLLSAKRGLVEVQMETQTFGMLPVGKELVNTPTAARD